MKKILSFYNTHKKNCCLAAGLILSCLFMAPFLILGEGSIITYHDQLDGELFSYLLTAKYLFTDIRVYPEIMNGLPAAGTVPPAPLFVLLYVILRPFPAFLLSQWILYLAAFLGMYLLLLRLTGEEFISFSIAVIFMLLPFYPVYGLCIPGQPLLFFAVLTLLDKETSARASQKPFFSKDTVFYYVLVLLYGAASSPVLVGFACLLLLGIFALFQSIKALREKRKIPCSPWTSLGLLLISYIAANRGLIRQVLSPGTTYVSHKTEMVLSPQNFSDYFKEAFTTGISYAQSYPMAVFILGVLCLVLWPVLSFLSSRKKPGRERKLYSLKEFSLPYRSQLIKISGIFLFIIIACLFYAFYHGNIITELRNSSGGLLKTFNLDRICWLLPTAWCMLAGYLLSFIADPFKSGTASGHPQSPSACSGHSCDHSLVPAHLTPQPPKSLTGSPAKSFLKYGIILAVLSIWGITVLLHSSLRPNISKLIKGEDYYALDWNNFFAEDIFTQIGSAIGKPRDSYHVISVGIYPAAAAYNGFYCLDGYSNNYPLEYKHTFRRIIKGELNKNDYVRGLFDNWGNRCYVTTAEQANYYTFEKKWNSVIYDLDLDIDQLRKLDCQYIFSAAYLMNAQEKGLSLLRETPFETENSWYHIYVYEVN